jgi:hypothetical protein
MWAAVLAAGADALLRALAEQGAECQCRLSEHTAEAVPQKLAEAEAATTTVAVLLGQGCMQA